MKKEKPPVADETPKPPCPFDVRTVEALVGLMAEHGLNEIDLRDGPQRLRLRRGVRQVVVPGAAPAALPPAPAPASASPTPAAHTSAAAPAKNLVEIKSETVGTFYARPKPESASYVQIGSRVEPDTVVCQIEAMKTFNEIPAGCRGVIVEICVQNEQYVEFGQVLFRVDPAA